MENIEPHEIQDIIKRDNQHFEIDHDTDYLKHKISSFTLLKLHLRKLGFVDGIDFKHEFKGFHLMFKDRQNIEVKKKDTLFIGKEQNMIWMEGVQTNGKYRNI